jgi:hypothetical protein
MLGVPKQRQAEGHAKNIANTRNLQFRDGMRAKGSQWVGCHATDRTHVAPLRLTIGKLMKGKAPSISIYKAVHRRNGKTRISFVADGSKRLKLMKLSVIFSTYFLKVVSLLEMAQ